MKSNSKWNWLVALSVVAILSFFSVGNAHAWGPLAQSAIAQAVQRVDGVPPAMASRNFVLETTMPKIFENTDQAYAKNSYDYTDIMRDQLHGITHYCQALAWGASQTAEKTGDYQFFQNNSANCYQRWINELLSDSLLYAIDSPYYGTAVAETAVIPKLVSDASLEYTSIFGGEPFDGTDALLAAHFNAHVLVGELAIVTNPNFQAHARRILDTAEWRMAMDQSVENAAEYVINSTQASSVSDWLVIDASDHGTQLLGKLGSVLVAGCDAAIAGQNNMGVYTYRVGLSTDQVNDITLEFLFNMSRRLDEPPVMRSLARRLYDLMSDWD